jgi:ABC-type branched-subunit amino acid transport system substrate-binding protein
VNVAVPVRPVLGLAALVLALALPLSLAPAQGATASVGSCAGFHNRIGMTNKVIHLANASDISGPVPGLYASAQDAARAYVRYFNSQHKICGRSLVLDRFDSSTDGAADKTASTRICAQDFAAIGSMATFDDGGAATAQACRLPDVRARSNSTARNSCASCFGAEAWRAGEAPNAIADYFLASHHAASQKAAVLYLNAGPFPERVATTRRVAELRGMKFLYGAGIDVADFNYGPYVQQLKSKGVALVEFFGQYQQAVRLAQAMASAAYKPEVRFFDSSVYRKDFAAQGGAAVDGTLTAIDSYPLTASQAQLNLYKTWLAKVAPGAAPTEDGLFAWSAAKLATDRMLALGGKLTRATLNASLRTVTGWTGGGMHAPMEVGTKHAPSCVRFLLLKGQTWVSVGGTAYRCTGVTKVG